MALWLVRSGSHGESERRFLDDRKIYFQWGGLTANLGEPPSQDEMFALMRPFYPDAAENAVWNWTRQAWAFAKRMEVDDWIVMPSKLKPAIHFARVTGPYRFDARAEAGTLHSRTVDWFALDIPRSNFDQDLLYSFGAFMTVCQIKRNDAEARIKAMAANGWKSSVEIVIKAASQPASDEEVVQFSVDEVARDSIAKLIVARFKGHGLSRLVDAVLRAQGYVTFLSQAGPDKGVDILAAPGALGFGHPRLCVQVKSGDSPVDSPTLNQLVGAMHNVGAEQGLLVSWGGFKTSVDRERPSQFFKVRLWDQSDLIAQLLESYERLDEDVRAELPLKRIWTVAELSADEA